MSHSNGRGAEALPVTQTQVIEDFKKVQTRLKTLVLTLKDFSNTENQQKNNKSFKSTTKRESFFRELNQMRDQVVTSINNGYFKKLNQLFTEVFDRFSAYIDELWKHMVNHDDTQASRVTREFNEFFNEKTSKSNKLFNDIQQLMNDIENAESN